MYMGSGIMLKWTKKIINILFGVLIIAVSVNMFLGPHNIASGGVTGLSIIVEHISGIDRAITVLSCNALILVLTYFLLGTEVFLNTVIGALSLPLIMGFVPHITVIDDVMLSVIVGSVLFGAAVQILYKNNASSGGTSIPPLIFKKYFNLNTSIGLFATDSFVVAASLIVFDVESFFYAILSIGITSATMSYLETGLNRKKTLYIISEKEEAIRNDLLYVVKRGVTIIPIMGGYNKKHMQMLMVTVNYRDYPKVIELVNKYDEMAFVIINAVADVHGLGFTYHSASV